MITFILGLISGIILIGLGIWFGFGNGKEEDREFGATRSPLWDKVQKQFLFTHPTCAVCGSKQDLNVHHKKPFHNHPELELQESNLITLCRVHHFWFGHLGNWASWNETVEEDSKEFNNKIIHRP